MNRTALFVLVSGLVACGGGAFSTESLSDSDAGSQAGSAGTSQAGSAGQPSAGSAGSTTAGSSGVAGQDAAGSAGQNVAGTAGQGGAGSAGQAGVAGQAGSSGSSGSSNAGSSGVSGQSGAGSGGIAGQAGVSGSAGQSGAGMGGAAGQSAAGSAGQSGAGMGGSAGAGQAGSAGQGGAGSGGAGSSGQAGQSGSSGTAGQSGGAGTSGLVVPDDVAKQFISIYATKMHTTKKLTPLNLPVAYTTTYDTYGLAAIVRDGEGLKITETSCHIDAVTDDPLTTMQIPDAVPLNTPAIVSPFRAWLENGTLNFARDESVVVLGAELVNPRTDPLPLKPTDATVRDSDKDGAPGVTSNFQLHALASWTHSAQRQLSSYFGAVAADGKLTGEYFYTSEQTVLESNGKYTQTPWKQTSMTGAGMNTVTIVKLQNSLDCATLVAQKDSLF